MINLCMLILCFDGVFCCLVCVWGGGGGGEWGGGLGRGSESVGTIRT